MNSPPWLGLTSAFHKMDNDSGNDAVLVCMVRQLETILTSAFLSPFFSFGSFWVTLSMSFVLLPLCLFSYSLVSIFPDSILDRRITRLTKKSKEERIMDRRLSFWHLASFTQFSFRVTRLCSTDTYIDDDTGCWRCSFVSSWRDRLIHLVGNEKILSFGTHKEKKGTVAFIFRSSKSEIKVSEF